MTTMIMMSNMFFEEQLAENTKYIQTGVIGVINYIDNGSLYPYGLQTEEKQGDFVSPFNLQPINY